MTEHAAVIFVFFFLAEYASIILICILTSILFLGGYLYDYLPFSIISVIEYFRFEYLTDEMLNRESNPIDSIYNPLLEGLYYGLSLGIKSCIMIFIFIWVRAS